MLQQDIDHFLGDPKSDVVVQRSELPISDAANPFDKDSMASDMPDPSEKHNMAFVPPVTTPAADEIKPETPKEAVVEKGVEVEKKEDPLAKEIERLRSLRATIKQQEEERIARVAEIAADNLMPPIKFRDAVNRRFSFPWKLCKTWQGMEALINQEFLYVDVLGEHVQEGHYDLMGPDGEIFLPQVWDALVKPGISITMHMWPMPEDAQNPRQESIRPQESSRSVKAPPQPSGRKAVIDQDSDSDQSHQKEQPFPQISACRGSILPGRELGYEPSGIPEDHQLTEAATLPDHSAEQHGEPSDGTSPVTKPNRTRRDIYATAYMLQHPEARDDFQFR